jgi:hypothetical protein
MEEVILFEILWNLVLKSPFLSVSTGLSTNVFCVLYRLVYGTMSSHTMTSLNNGCLERSVLLYGLTPSDTRSG